ncbi:MAG: ATP-binding cassette domain-containing protein [Acidobacteria bacterium]|nr:ATP-binding cassette domain-containing protein [Acidobacteriota bacterium]
MEAAVSVTDISKSYDTKRAVAGLSLEVPRGSLFGLLGPNGAGKTTTIRMILDIYGPDTGTIRVLGQPWSESLKSRIGYLPEERGLYTRMKVGDVLVFIAGIKGVPATEAKTRAKSWLSRLELADTWEKKVQELSKGMQQKVQFISTVLHEPELIILDEPFSGLDPINTNVLRDIMVEYHHSGRTVIFSTHIMEQVEKLCDGICLINEGRMVLGGNLHEIKGRYGRNTIALGFEGDGAFLKTHPLVKRTSEYNAFIEVTLVDGADPQALLKDVVARVRVSRFEIKEPSLHDIFIERVGATKAHAGAAPPPAPALAAGASRS